MKKGELARIADYSATGKFNSTNVLVTVVSKLKPSNSNFLPLTVILTFMLLFFFISMDLSFIFYYKSLSLVIKKKKSILTGRLSS